jgi:predicted CXXCH cytochrome family protein
MRMHALIASLTLLILTAPQLAGAKVRGSKHDLSGRGGAGDGMDQICYFCHTPHTLLPVAPAWSREQSAIIYTPYWSPTLEASVGQPTGTSKICLSCHDGTIARSSVPDPADPGGRRIGPFRLSQRANLGSDLSDDHPISFVYDSGLALEDRELVDPATLPAEITLDSNDEMQCTSCHDPHVSRYPKFLAMDNAYSKLCLACHDKRGWAQSAHSTSPTGWNGSGVNPWPFSNETTVSANACASCHTSHAAAVPESLLVFAPEEENCFSCHDGSVAELDVASEFRKSFRHPLEQSSGVHVATEDPLAMPRHVECSDCHNPHAAFQGRALAPNLPGSLTGVAGVSASGTPLVTARYEFEICYRCHADGPDVPSPYIERQIQEPNIRLKLDIRNPSYHPVVDQGQNLDVPSLIYPLRETSLIYCSDCHSGSSDATVPGAAGSGSRGFGVHGPHGSDWPFLLSQPYSVADGTVENYQAYALCYKCHDRNVLLADGSTGLHHEHVVEQDSTCSVCHDPHGISATQGNRTNNSHLINFDISIVKPVPAGAGPIGDPNAGMGLLQFEDLGSNSGRCYLLCHGAVHNPAEY